MLCHSNLSHNILRLWKHLELYTRRSCGSDNKSNTTSFYQQQKQVVWALEPPLTTNISPSFSIRQHASKTDVVVVPSSLLPVVALQMSQRTCSQGSIPRNFLTLTAWTHGLQCIRTHHYHDLGLWYIQRLFPAPYVVFQLPWEKKYFSSCNHVG